MPVAGERAGGPVGKRAGRAGSRPASRPGAVAVVVHAVALGLACLASYTLTTRGLAAVHSVSPADDQLGGMWAVAATVFVFRAGLEESAACAVGRIAATGVSFALCLVHLALFPFTAWGLAAVVAAGAVVVSPLGRPQDTVTTGITSAVVLVVAALAPGDAWLQPVLRLADTLVGVVVGLAGAWLVSVPWLTSWTRAR